MEHERDISFRVASQTPGQFGPVLGVYLTLLRFVKLQCDNQHHVVSFPSVQPPRDTPFDVYLRKKSSNAEDSVPDAKNTLIAGESEAVEFASSSESQVASSGSRRATVYLSHESQITTLSLAA